METPFRHRGHDEFGVEMAAIYQISVFSVCLSSQKDVIFKRLHLYFVCLFSYFPSTLFKNYQKFIFWTFKPKTSSKSFDVYFLYAIILEYKKSLKKTPFLGKGKFFEAFFCPDKRQNSKYRL